MNVLPVTWGSSWDWSGREWRRVDIDERPWFWCVAGRCWAGHSTTAERTLPPCSWCGWTRRCTGSPEDRSRRSSPTTFNQHHLHTRSNATDLALLWNAAVCLCRRGSIVTWKQNAAKNQNWCKHSLGKGVKVLPRCVSFQIRKSKVKAAKSKNSPSNIDTYLT